MGDVLIRKQENPARAFLRRYRAMCARQDSLLRSIDEAHIRAMSCTVRLKSIHVTGGNGAYDRMAEDVAHIVDAEDQLWAALQDVRSGLAEILEAISAVPDDAQKTVLTLRYIEGCSWPAIQEYMHYERTQAYVIHGWALQSVLRWMEQTGRLEVRTKTDYPL